MPHVWESQARFCPLCGAALGQALVEGKERAVCRACGFVLYQNPASASCAVIVRSREVCLVKRSIEPFRGHWTFPAGYQEYSETAQEAAIREAREECGLDIEILSLIDVLYTRDDARKRANLTVYLARPIGGELAAGDDALDAAFFPLEELPAEIGFANNRWILAELRRRCGPGQRLEDLR